MEKYIKIIKKNAKWILMLITILAFVYIVHRIYQNNIDKFDNKIYQIIALFIHPRVTQMLKIITHFGDWVVMIPVSIVMLIKNRKYGILVSINLISIFTFNQILKLIFNRQRPVENRLIEVDGYSFPSGHAMISMAFYGLFIYFIYQNIKNKKLKYTTCLILVFLIFVVGISRIYLGVHYASDVVGGFLFSIAYLIIFIQMIKEKEQQA